MDTSKLYIYCEDASEVSNEYEICAISASMSETERNLVDYGWFLQENNILKEEILSKRVELNEDDLQLLNEFLIKESIDIILDLESCFSKNPTVRKYIPSKYLIEESILFKNTKYLYELHCGEVYMFITESD